MPEELLRVGGHLKSSQGNPFQLVALPKPRARLPVIFCQSYSLNRAKRHNTWTVGMLVP